MHSRTTFDGGSFEQSLKIVSSSTGKSLRKTWTFLSRPTTWLRSVGIQSYFECFNGGFGTLRRFFSPMVITLSCRGNKCPRNFWIYRLGERFDVGNAMYLELKNIIYIYFGSYDELLWTKMYEASKFYWILSQPLRGKFCLHNSGEFRVYRRSEFCGIWRVAGFNNRRDCPIQFHYVVAAIHVSIYVAFHEQYRRDNYHSCHFIVPFPSIA